MKLLYTTLKDDRTILNIFITILCLFLANFASAQNTYVPDNNFEQALIDLGYDTAPLDDYVPTANISGVTYLEISYRGISDLTGIDDFSSVTSLYVDGNAINTIDVSNIPALEELGASSCNLSTIDVSSNPALTRLVVSSNQLTSIDVSSNPLLDELQCQGNQIPTLDVSSNPALTALFCHENLLTSLDVTMLPNLFSLDFGSNNIGAIDLSNNTVLNNLVARYSQLNALDLTNNPNLDYVDLDNNNLSTIDFSNNTAITQLNIGGNNIPIIDFSPLVNVTNLYVEYSSALTEVDVTGNPNLVFLGIGGNPNLTSADLRNGANTNISYFYGEFNPALTCINVDDEVYSTTNWTYIDPHTVFSNDCSLLVLPVELVDFNAHHNGTFVQLEWQTASEENNDYFEIQKSQDGVEFESIGKVIGKGTTFELNSYTFPDQDPFRGINYYRLKQVDFDGQYEYSKVVSVNLEKANELTLYPNPTDGVITIEGVTDENPMIKITDQWGRVVMTVQRARFNIAHLPKGAYNVSVIEKRDLKVFRVNRL